MTNVDEIDALVAEYRSWLKDRTIVRSTHPDWVEITTPFIDRHNDSIQLYVRSDNGGFRLTDDGHTLRDLEISGCLLNTPKRQSLLRTAIAGFAVEESDGILSVRTSRDNFSARKHALVQAILAVNDLFYTAGSTTRSLFKEDVAAWLDAAEIRYLPDVPFVGRSGYVHHFDFAIPRSRSAPERIVKAVNHPNKETAQTLIFSWLDSREERPSDSQALAVLNDRDRTIPTSVIDALAHYEIGTVLWTEREIVRPKLAA
jgi:hypothetical protein